MLRRLVHGLLNEKLAPCRPGATPIQWLRTIQHQAFDDAFDQDELSEARKWREAFQQSSIPKGQTVFSRSSGPGGQHVNKSVPGRDDEPCFRSADSPEPEPRPKL